MTARHDRPRWLVPLVASISAVLSLLFVLTGIGTPLPWLDESATMLAVSRPWPGLFALLGGADAPLVPYYVVAKVWAAVWVGLPPLVAVRSLSAVAAAGAVGVIVAMVSRHAQPVVGVLAGALLISLPGFVRFAQEARPAALLVFTATAAWAAWTAWHWPLGERRSSGALPVFVLASAASVLSSLFAFFQWPGLLVASLLGDGRAPLGWRRAAKTMIALAAAVVLVAYPAYLAARLGTGPTIVPVVSPALLGSLLLRTGAVLPVPEPILIPVVLAGITVPLAVAGRLSSGESRLVRICWSWFVVPLALTLAVGIGHPQLLQPRYLQPVLVPLAILAAVGLGGVARAVAGRSGAGRRVLAAVLVAGVLVAQAWPVCQVQAGLRRPGGHDGSLPSLLAAVDRAEQARPDAVVLNGSDRTAALLLASRPVLAATDPVWMVEQDSATVWPVRRPAEETQAALVGERAVIWMVARSEPGLPPSAPPAILRGLGFSVRSAEPVPSGFVVLLER